MIVARGLGRKNIQPGYMVTFGLGFAVFLESDTIRIVRIDVLTEQMGIELSALEAI